MENTQLENRCAAVSVPLDIELLKVTIGKLEHVLGASEAADCFPGALAFVLRHSTGEAEQVSARLQSLCLQVEALFLPQLLEEYFKSETADTEARAVEKPRVMDPSPELTEIVSALTETRSRLEAWSRDSSASLTRFTSVKPELRELILPYLKQLLCFGNALAARDSMETLRMVAPLWSDRQTAPLYAIFRDIVRVWKWSESSGSRIPEPHHSNLETCRRCIVEAVLVPRLATQIGNGTAPIQDSELTTCRMIQDTDPALFQHFARLLISKLDYSRSRIFMDAAAVDRATATMLRWDEACMLFVYRAFEAMLSWQEKLAMLRTLCEGPEDTTGAAAAMQSLSLWTVSVSGERLLESFLQAFDINLTPDSYLDNHENAELSLTGKSQEALSPIQSLEAPVENRLTRFSREFEALCRRHRESRKRMQRQQQQQHHHQQQTRTLSTTTPFGSIVETRHCPSVTTQQQTQKQRVYRRVLDGSARHHAYTESSAVTVAAANAAGTMTVEEWMELLSQKIAQLRMVVDSGGKRSPEEWYLWVIRPALLVLAGDNSATFTTWVSEALKKLEKHFGSNALRCEPASA
jgi:hypothetical protein